jgi:hypothetical protein
VFPLTDTPHDKRERQVGELPISSNSHRVVIYSHDLANNNILSFTYEGKEYSVDRVCHPVQRASPPHLQGTQALPDLAKHPEWDAQHWVFVVQQVTEVIPGVPGGRRIISDGTGRIKVIDKPANYKGSSSSTSIISVIFLPENTVSKPTTHYGLRFEVGLWPPTPAFGLLYLFGYVVDAYLKFLR